MIIKSYDLQIDSRHNFDGVKPSFLEPTGNRIISIVYPSKYKIILPYGDKFDIYEGYPFILSIGGLSIGTGHVSKME